MDEPWFKLKLGVGGNVNMEKHQGVHKPWPAKVEIESLELKKLLMRALYLQVNKK